MAHPFEKLFDAAIKKSTELDNQVLNEANRLLAKGYQGKEIALVLMKLQKSLIDTTQAAVVLEALTEFEQYLPEVDEV